MTRFFAIVLCLAVLIASAAAQIDTTFTYQGELVEAGNLADGSYDFEFSLWDAAAGGMQEGLTETLTGVQVSQGRFTVSLDFGAEVYNEQRWLQIVVNGTPLSPRQAVTAAPTALHLRGVNLAANGRFGIGTLSPTGKWTVDQEDEIAIYGQSLYNEAIVGVAASDNRSAVWGINSAGSGYGVRGMIDSSPGAGRGVWGSSFANEGAGVWGEMTNSAGVGYGVYGRTVGAEGYSAGVFGVAESASGNTRGGSFHNYSSTGGASAILAQAHADSGHTYGVQASVASPDGRAVNGYVGSSSGGYAIRGSNNNEDGYAGYFLGRVHMRDHTTVGKSNVKVTSAEQFGVHTTAESGQFGGMYVSGQNTGAFPFYGYSSNGQNVDAYHYYDGGSNHWKLWTGGTRLSVNRFNGYVGLGETSPAYPLHMASGARCTSGGTWVNASSREMKHDFEAVDARMVLQRVLALPIKEWSYLSEDGVRHIGPVAEDFAQLFALGDDARAIATVDADGVALASIQALHELIEAKGAHLSRQARQIDSLERSNAGLEARLRRLEQVLAELGSRKEGAP